MQDAEETVSLDHLLKVRLKKTCPFNDVFRSIDHHTGRRIQYSTLFYWKGGDLDNTRNGEAFKNYVTKT